MNSATALESLKFYRKQFPRHIVLAFAKQNFIDLDFMAVNYPWLYEMYVYIGVELSTPVGTTLWKNYVAANDELVATASYSTLRGLVSLVVSEKVGVITEMANGHPRISLDSIEDCVVRHKSKKNSWLSIDYADFMDLIKAAYSIDPDDLLHRYSGDDRLVDSAIAQTLGLSLEQRKELATIKPSNSIDACKMILLSEFISNEIELHYSIWDHLLDNELMSVNNGDHVDLDLNDSNYTSDTELQLFGSIRKIMFKELWQIKEFNDLPTSINFYFSW